MYTKYGRRKERHNLTIAADLRGVGAEVDVAEVEDCGGDAEHGALLVLRHPKNAHRTARRSKLAAFIHAL
jgi:hypothetical protein|tara:strand:+ start:1851 stop:2060 length:210 start_codon:yes stop_codon:yes gene_type:complete